MYIYEIIFMIVALFGYLLLVYHYDQVAENSTAGWVGIIIFGFGIIMLFMTVMFEPKA